MQKIHHKIIGAAIGWRINDMLELIDTLPKADRPADVLTEVVTSPAEIRSVEILVDHGWDVNSKDSQYGKPAISFAASLGKADIVELLIQRGADVNATDKTGHTASESACTERTGGHFDSLSALVAAGADVNIGTVFSPLMTAVEQGTEAMVRLLLKSGVNLSRWYRSGHPLLKAVEFNRTSFAPILLEAGANPQLVIPPEADLASREFGQATIYEVARKLGRTKILAMFDGKPVELPRTQHILIRPLWKTIEQKIEENGEQVSEVLNPGVSSSELATLESALSISLPEDLRRSWMIHNGMVPEVAAFFLTDDPVMQEIEGAAGCFRLLPAQEWEEVIRRNVAIREELGDEANRFTSDRGVTQGYWNAGWLPVAQNMSGDILCCDLAPTEGGAKGQIILCSSEDPIRRKLFDSWYECFESLSVAWGGGASL